MDRAQKTTVPLIYQMPDNEFTEHCTGDMHDMDTVYHHWMQDKWKNEREAYNKKHAPKDTNNRQGEA